MDMRAVPSHLVGARRIDFRPTGGRQYLPEEQLVEQAAAAARRRPDLEFLLTILTPLGPRSISKWFTAADIDRMEEEGLDHFALVWDNSLYSGVAFEELTGHHPISQIRGATMLVRQRQQNAGGCRPDNATERALNSCFSRAIATAFSGAFPKLPNLGDYVKYGGVTLAQNCVAKAVAGVPDSAPIPLSAMPKLEAKMPGIALFVHGESPEHSYISAKKAAHTIHLRLRDGHYSNLSQPNRPSLPPARAFTSEKGRFLTLGELKAMEARGEVTPEQKAEWLRNPQSSETCILRGFITAEEWEARRAELEASGDSDALACWTKRRDVLVWAAFRAKMTEVLRLDPGRYAGNILRYALEAFRLLSMCIPASAPISLGEADMIEAASRGGLIYSRVFDGQARQLDYNSYYPWIASQKGLLLPTGAGELKQLPRPATPPKFYSIGVYRAIVSGIPDCYRCLWGGRPLGRVGTFTHTDLATALMLGGSVELAQDGQANACIYDRAQCVSGLYAFGPYVSALYPHKRAGSAAAKKMLNLLTGAVYAKRKTKVTASAAEMASGALIDLPEHVIAAYPQEDGAFTIVHEHADPSERWTGPYPRWGAFITAKARHHMAKVLMPAAKAGAIVRIFTDSVCLEASFPIDHKEMPLGFDIGQLKLEHEGRCILKDRSRRPVWE